MILCGVLLAVGLLVWRLACDTSRPPRAGAGGGPAEIPKKVWTYWDGPRDEVVDLCIDRCRRMNPGYDLTVLNRENVRSLVPELPAHLLSHPNLNDSAARTADLVRCFVIAHRGGVWMDASIVCLRPFDDWLDRQAQFVGFFIRSFTQQEANPVIESWFFASRPGCPFMEEWCREFTRLSEFKSVEEYIEHLKASGVFLQGITSTSYLAIHCAAQKVMQQTLPGIASELKLQPAEDGPFSYLDHPDVNWDSRKGVLHIAASRWDEADTDSTTTTPFFKLRGNERKALRELGEHDRQRFYDVLRYPEAS